MIESKEIVYIIYFFYDMHSLSLSLCVKEFLTVFIGQQILYCLEKVIINSPYAVSTSADLNTLSQHSSARLFESDNSVFSLIIRFFTLHF